MGPPRPQDLLAFLEARRGQCGVIYARLRATCDWLAGALGDAGLDCAAYHAGKDSQQRARVGRRGGGGWWCCCVLQQWLSAAVSLAVALAPRRSAGELHA